MNSWHFTGRLIGDPNYREVSGAKVCDFTVSVRTRGRDEQGYPKSVLARCTCWRKLAELCEQFGVCKGKVLALSGMLDLREYTNKDGVLCKSLEVDVNDIDFLLQSAPMPDKTTTTADAPAVAVTSEYTIVNQDELPF
jgi:single-stranded DNA-binding protein